MEGPLQMIPKVIHYCWFGRGKLSDLAVSCIGSWRKLLPEYEIKIWNEDNFDVNCCEFTKEAYDLRKFAFVADYVRLYALHTEGGIYLDTDVEVIRPFDDLLELDGFIGFEEGPHIGTAVLGAVASSSWTRGIIAHYADVGFINWNGSLNDKPNPYIFESYFLQYGLSLDGALQDVCEGVRFLPLEYLCGKEYSSGALRITNDTYCIHHYEGSWVDSGMVLGRLFKRLTRIVNKVINSALA